MLQRSWSHHIWIRQDVYASRKVKCDKRDKSQTVISKSQEEFDLKGKELSGSGAKKNLI